MIRNDFPAPLPRGSALDEDRQPPDEEARDAVKRERGICLECGGVFLGRVPKRPVAHDTWEEENASLKSDLSLARDQRDEALNDKAQVEKERDSFKAEVERRVTANARANIASADIARERDSLRKMVAELEVKLVEARKERPNWQTTADTIDAQARADVWEKAFRILARETKAGGQ